MTDPSFEQLESQPDDGSDFSFLEMTGMNTPEEDKKKHDSDQLVSALYLGIGMTVLLIIIGVIVELIRKKYFEDGKDDDVCLCIDSRGQICCPDCLKRNSEIEDAELRNHQKGPQFQEEM